MTSPAISVHQVSHRYGPRRALEDVTFDVAAGEIFALLGPNGGGKTTLFRLLCTLIPLQQGRLSVAGFDAVRQTAELRRRIGVVFQAASLDRLLTVEENLRHQGHLYGLRGPSLVRRCDELLERFGLVDRRHARCAALSGGQRRRVELAKGLLHRPPVLLLDEPSTGLDPGARRDLWDYLTEVRSVGVTILLTTHLLDEADHADRLAIFDRGRLVALDSPERLRAEVGGDSITIEATDARALAESIRLRFQCVVQLWDETVRLEQPQGHTWIPRLVEAFGPQIRSITLGHPTLEDLFIARTGHRFRESVESTPADQAARATASGGHV